MTLTLKVTELKPRFFTITLAGALDSSTYMLLDNKIENLVTEGAARIITLDMSGVTYISSMGVRSVFKAKKNLARQEGSFLMVNLQPQVKKVFEIIDALPSMQVFANMREMDDYLTRMQSNEENG